MVSKHSKDWFLSVTDRQLPGPYPRQMSSCEKSFNHLAADEPDVYPEYIKQARANAGLTQSAMADLLHVSIKTVQAWEYGTNPMPWAYWKLFQILTAQHSA